MKNGSIFVDIDNYDDLSPREYQIIRALLNQHLNTLVLANLASSAIDHGKSVVSDERFQELVGITQKWADQMFSDLKIRVRWEAADLQTL